MLYLYHLMNVVLCKKMIKLVVQFSLIDGKKKGEKKVTDGCGKK